MQTELGGFSCCSNIQRSQVRILLSAPNSMANKTVAR